MKRKVERGRDGGRQAGSKGGKGVEKVAGSRQGKG